MDAPRTHWSPNLDAAFDPEPAGARQSDFQASRPLPPAASESDRTAYSTSTWSPSSSSLSVMNDGSFSTAFWSSSTPTTA